MRLKSTPGRQAGRQAIMSTGWLATKQGRQAGWLAVGHRHTIFVFLEMFLAGLGGPLLRDTMICEARE